MFVFFSTYNKAKSLPTLKMIGTNTTMVKKLKDPVPIMAHSYPVEKQTFMPIPIQIPREMEFAGRRFSFDAGYMKTQRGLLKITQIVSVVKFTNCEA